MTRLDALADGLDDARALEAEDRTGAGWRGVAAGPLGEVGAVHRRGMVLDQDEAGAELRVLRLAPDQVAVLYQNRAHGSPYQDMRTLTPRSCRYRLRPDTV